MKRKLLMILLVVVMAVSMLGTTAIALAATENDRQIAKTGGTVTSEDGEVTVSKTIEGTGIENVFDITLQVKTKTDIQQVYQNPEMAVVIVMDISNTMRYDFAGNETGDKSAWRYTAAMNAATDFINLFQENSVGISTTRKVGYVAFNTNATEIFPMSDCKTEEQAAGLIGAMKTKTGNIINPDSYNTDKCRFTNMDAGLKMAQDMLEGVSARNKYVMLISDGLPNTYVQSGYTGYDNATDSGSAETDGIFYDRKQGLPCKYGTDYSDKAAAKAQARANSLKQDGVEIFSIGVAVGNLTVDHYLKLHAGKDFSTIDCYAGGDYVIGDASSQVAYKHWLGNNIASGYNGHYFDSTNASALMQAYQEIFKKIQQTTEAAASASWVAQDPMAAFAPSYVEFISFYNKAGVLADSKTLTGAWEPGAENTAGIGKGDTIQWDLKHSGYMKTGNGSDTEYIYTLKYRMRLKNELNSFKQTDSEGSLLPYDTNGTTTLTYQVVKKVNDEDVLSEQRTMDFPVPAVNGYLSTLRFVKKDAVTGEAMAGVTFTLKHDSGCPVCEETGSFVEIDDISAASDSSGNVTLTNIPSGHAYILTEIVPDGYCTAPATYQVQVDYGTTTVRAFEAGHEVAWTGVIKNVPVYPLTVSKTVDGSIGKDREFTFCVRLTDADGSPISGAYPYTGKSDISGVQAPADGTLQFVNGTATFTLMHGQSITIGAIPHGVGYTVTELNHAGYAVTVNQQAADSVSGELTEVAFAAFTNRYAPAPVSAGLSAEKVVSGDMPTMPEQFAFKMEAMSYTAPAGFADAMTPAQMPMPAGSADGAKTVTRSGAGPVVFGTYLYTTAGTYVYRVSEIGEGNRSYAYDNTVYTVTDVVTDINGALCYTRTITVKDGHTALRGIVFDNTYTAPKGTLTIGKTVTGNAGDQTRNFAFTLMLKKQSGAPLTGTLSYTGSAISGVEEPADAVRTLDSRGQTTFVLRHGQSITIDGLPEGTYYMVIETDYADYTVTVNGVEGNVAQGTITSTAAATVAFVNDLTEIPDSPPPLAPPSSGDPDIPIDDPDIPTGPATGDGANLWLYAALLALAVILGAGAILLRRYAQKK